MNLISGGVNRDFEVRRFPFAVHGSRFTVGDVLAPRLANGKPGTANREQ